MAERTQPDRVEQAERARLSAPELSWALRAVNRANAEAEAELARRLGMRPLDYAAMGHVLTSAEPLGPADLSARLGISTGSATELVDRLERGGHLRREPHPHDRRRVTLRATEPAVARVLETLTPLFTAIDALAEQFTPDERDAIARYLRATAHHLHDYAHPGEPVDQRPG